MMLPWDLLARFEITKDESATLESTPLPETPKPSEFSLHKWFDEIATHDPSNMFLAYVRDLVGQDMGGRSAVMLQANFVPSSPGEFLQHLCAARLSNLVVIDPFAENERWVGKMGDMKVLVLRADPLQFLSQIDPGPSVLFFPTYGEGSFVEEFGADDYFRALAAQLVRVISNSTNIIRTSSSFGRGVPILAGFDCEIYRQLVPMDVEPINWAVEVAQFVTEKRPDGELLIGLAAKAKS